MEKRKMICFDMDGTIADLYGCPDWLKMLNNEDPTPYYLADPMWDMDKLCEVLTALQFEGWTIAVVTWLSMNSSADYKKAVRVAKMTWLDEQEFIYDEFHAVQYGTTKANCVRGKTDYAVLIDDNEKVRNGWTLGDTIDPTKEDLIAKLWDLLKE
jgi:hypothetical protein